MIYIHIYIYMNIFIFIMETMINSLANRELDKLRTDRNASEGRSC